MLPHVCGNIFHVEEFLKQEGLSKSLIRFCADGANSRTSAEATLKEKAGARDVVITGHEGDVKTIAPGLYFVPKQNPTQQGICSRRVRALFESYAVVVKTVVTQPKIVETCPSLGPPHFCDIATSEDQEGVIVRVGRNPLESCDGSIDARLQ